MVSIITPTYNSSETISDTIKSIINQTYKDWELIIIDDFSTDNSIEIVQNFQIKDSRIRLIDNAQNLGAAYTRNIGLKVAKGRYIAFLDSDDTWDSSKLEFQLSVMKKKKLAFTHTAYNVVNNRGEFLKTNTVKEICDYEDLLKCNYVFCSTVMIDTQRFLKIEMPNLRRRQDWGLWLTLLRNTNEIAYGINVPLCYYRISDNSLSSNKIKLIKYNYFIYKNILKYSQIKSTYYFLRFFVFHFLKKINIK